MTETKKMHSFRMKPCDIRTLQRLARENQCTQIAILEHALHRYFTEQQDRQPAAVEKKI